MTDKAILPETVISEICDELDQIKSPGAIVEIGAYRCGTTIELAKHCPDRTVYALDAFGGPGKIDSFKNVDFGDVQADTAPYPNIRLVRGDICETVKTLNDPVALILIDCDDGEPCDVALEHLVPLLVEGGRIVVDDAEFEGIKQSCNKYLDGWSSVKNESGLVIRQR